MDTGAVGAWASLLAAAAGLAAIISSFVLENRRRDEATRDRLLSERKAAVVGFLAAVTKLEGQMEASSTWFQDPTGQQPVVDLDAYGLAENELQLVEPRLAMAEGERLCIAVRAISRIHSDWLGELRRARLRDTSPPNEPSGMGDARLDLARAKADFVVAAMRHLGTDGGHRHE
jgi:hypothetical protein